MSGDAMERYQHAGTVFGQGQYKEALDILEELAVMYPHEKELMYTRALCLEKLGRKQEA